MPARSSSFVRMGSLEEAPIGRSTANREGLWDWPVALGGRLELRQLTSMVPVKALHLRSPALGRDSRLTAPGTPGVNPAVLQRCLGKD